MGQILIGLLLGVLTASVVFMAIVSISNIISHIRQRKKTKEATQVALSMVGEILTEEIQLRVSEKSGISLLQLEEAANKKFGSQGLIVADCIDGKLVPDSVEIVKSNQKDDEVDELFENGIALINY